MRNLQAGSRNSLFVSAGDLIGATPLLSALFHDEPTIEAMNLIGLDVNGVGNHEFDEGVPELRRMQYGNRFGGDGCHPVDGCLDGTPFEGADFTFLAANVTYENTPIPIFPPFTIKSFPNGVKVAIFGMTLEETPSIVSASAVAPVDFHDEAGTQNTAGESALGDRIADAGAAEPHHARPVAQGAAGARATGAGRPAPSVGRFGAWRRGRGRGRARSRRRRRVPRSSAPRTGCSRSRPG